MKRTHPSPSTLSKSHTVKKNISRSSSASKCKAFLSFDSFGVWGVWACLCVCVYMHLWYALTTHSQNCLWCSQESLQQKRCSGLQGLQQSDWIPQEGSVESQLCTARALGWPPTSHSNGKSLTEEDVFKKPYLSRREGKLNAAEDKARETLRACSLNEQLKAAVNKVPHRRNNNNNN